MPEQKTSAELRAEIEAMVRTQQNMDLQALNDQIARLQWRRELLTKRIELAEAIEAEKAGGRDEGNAS